MIKFFKVLLLTASCGLPAFAQAAGFPQRPVEVVITSTPGSTSDVLTRLIGKDFAETTGQPLVVVSKASASGLVGSSQVARARPDGYTLLLGGNTTMAANVHLFKSLPYDPLKDLAPVTLATVNPLLLVVRSDLPVKSVQDLIDYAKKHPGELNYGAGNSGGKVSVALLKSLAGIDATEVPYKGASQAALDLVAGRLQFMIVDPVVVDSFVKEGKLRPLAVTTKERLDSMPDLPTMEEAGVKGYEYASWLGYFAPRGTPDEVITSLHDALVKALNSKEATDYFERMGMIRKTTTPTDLTTFVQDQIATWGKLVNIADLQPQ
ncbi:Bug family tripartite tricarboxylate transporter substrate binding protein [Advenella mimigardefordensis]|uniref:Putative Bug-like extracytoplasmic solute binding receptor, TTT family n=1 Tax=Advenella mimigardefordensis (strain DSM 17166 / LMG 22922 / DPN7) TaxID=1247726 RepID=W0PEJ1_ADVMD|nr:tripartite tricarboxylate transporter substrate binding protein [Advenella mimigardefordensis]AHG63478.1 putative Bug-like extracytoplasmic solute binding receptor, TTT family [Advenella mimigardefordensis DPN7]